MFCIHATQFSFIFIYLRKSFTSQGANYTVYFIIIQHLMLLDPAFFLQFISSHHVYANTQYTANIDRLCDLQKKNAKENYIEDLYHRQSCYVLCIQNMLYSVTPHTVIKYADDNILAPFTI